MSSDPVSLINNLVKIAQTLRDVTSLIKDAETRNLIGDLNLALADLKIELASLKEENLLLKQRLKEFQKETDVEVVFQGGAYWISKSTGTQPKGPYCTACFDSGKKLILLAELEHAFRVVASHQCPKCQATYKVQQLI